MAQNPYISENKENQDEVTQVSPSYVRNGVLRVSFKPTEPRKRKIP